MTSGLQHTHQRTHSVTWLDPFDDELTRELPSALRTVTDLEPVSEVEAEDILELAEEDVVEVRPMEHTVRIARPSSRMTFTRDAPAPREAGARNEARGSLALILAAALVVSCAAAGCVGMVAGRTLSSRAPASRGPTARTAVVLGANELITVPAPAAPAKRAALRLPSPAPSPSLSPRPLRAALLRLPAASTPSTARGHLGSDRPAATPGR